MGNSQQQMPKVDFEQDNVVKSTHAYSKYIEAKNFERSIIAKKKLRLSRRIFTGCVVMVVGIYSYTILKIKQETFLDDFEEPPRIIKS